MPINPKSGETQDEFISRCIGVEVSSGKEQDQAAAICYSVWRKDKMSKLSGQDKIVEKLKFARDFKGINLGENSEACWPGYIQVGTKILDGREVPDCRGPVEMEEGVLPTIDSTYPGEHSTGSVEMEDGEIDIFGYQTKQFYICPGAIGTFEDLKSQTNLNEDTIGMIRSAAQLADNVFKIEKDAIESGSTTQEKLDEATVIVADFQDLIGEIEEEVGKDYDTSYMDGHLVTIKSYING